MTLCLHATTIALRQEDGTWRAVVLRGESGAGKSDLALRMTDRGAMLVADDRTELAVHDGRLYASAPAGIAGLLEIRGVGIRRMDHMSDRVPVVLIVDLVAAAADVPRLPDVRADVILGVAVGVVAFAAFECSTPVKIEHAVRRITQPEDFLP